MNNKSIWNDWGLWLLLALNLYAVYHCYQQPDSVDTIIAVFWIQSAFIGLFNVIGMLAFTNRVQNSFTVNDQPGNRPGCAAGFFAVHYGIFHLVYLVFLLIKVVQAKHIDWMFIVLSFWGILIGSIIQFMQDKRRNAVLPVNLGTMFFMPYLRIVPMHLAILLPSFLHVSAGMVFLLLKIVADVGMHIIYRKYLFKKA